MKKLNQVLTLAGVVAALLLNVNPVQAQGGGGADRGRQGFGNFDPAQMQQMMVDNSRESLQITNDDDWNVIRPLIEKVTVVRMEMMSFEVASFMGGRGGRGGGGGGGGAILRFLGGQANPAVESLQTAIDSGSNDQIKAAMDRYRAARKAAEAKLTEAQEALKKVLRLKQEAVALRTGLVN